MKVAFRPEPCPTRREFCAYACQVAAIAAAGAVAACGGSSPTSPSSGSASALNAVSASVTGRSVSVTIDATSPLTPVGSAAIVETALGRFLVSRTGQDSFAALTATCTHEACTITGFNGSEFVCPCHGSRFTTAGAVANGPATRPLQQYATQFADGVLRFTV